MMSHLTAFVFGTIAGSFFNVCIHRLPAGLSLLWPPSRCPSCGAGIRPYDNIPILSYIFLRGRCRACRERISIRYPLVEILTGLAAVAVLYLPGPWPHQAVGLVFLGALIVISFIDLDHQIIPDVISLPGIAVGFAAALMLGRPDWVSSLIGLLLGGGSLWLVAEAYFRVTGREGMGGGDIKLLAMVGAFLGWRAVPVTVMLASLTGSVVGIGLIVALGRDKRLPIPFGPFLAAGAACALFFGDALIDCYLNLVR